MSKQTNQFQRGAGTTFPGQEVCALDANKDGEWGVVTLFVSVPPMGNLPGSFVRFNLFSDVSGTQEHVASAICPAGTVGEAISVSGHIADTWHVYAQATESQQQFKVSLAAQSCCAPPKVVVRADLLSLAFAPAEVGASELQQFPVVPWGGEFGAPNTYTVTASGTIFLPKGARITHWLAQGTGGPPNTIRFDAQGTGPLISVGNAAPAREGFPAAQYATQIVYANLAFGLFEIVV